MKKLITNFKKLSLGIFGFVLLTANAGATTYTATQSGNWSSALTWGGAGSPGSIVGAIDNVVVPLGITVTLDMDVAINSLVSSLNVAGSLNSTNNSLTITQGTLQGTGIMNMYFVEIGSLGSMTFSGTITTGRFVNSGATIANASNIIINDSLILNSGSLAFNTGSTLVMNTNSNIKINAGSMSVNSGVLSAINTYHIIYTGSSKTSGIETGISAGASNVWINLADSSQILSMGNNVTIAGVLHHTMGKLAIGAHTLKLMGDYMATINGKIQAGATSRLILASVVNPISSTFILTSSSRFKYLEVNVSSMTIANFSGSFSVDSLYLKNGSAGFTTASVLTITPNGLLIIESGLFSFGTGSFDGANVYGVLYKGVNKTSAFELSGAGLQNVMVDLSTAANAVSLNTNLTVTGMLTLNKGSLNLNSHKIYLKGTYSSKPTGTFQGNAASSIFINNTTAAFGDTLYFAAAFSTLDSLSVNTLLASWVSLGSGLTVGNITLLRGGLKLNSGDLTINTSGSVTGCDSTKYIRTDGTGSLVMNVNMSAPYVVFPVGTSLNYSPASLQVIAGTSGLFRVNVQNGVWTNGTSGTNMALTQSVVNRTWYVQAPAQTGTLNANLQVQWKAVEEMNNFHRMQAFISHYTASAWDASPIASATLVNGSFYSITRTNLSSFSPFAVVDQNAVTGIEQTASTDATLNIYPNPATNTATIDFKNVDAKSLEIYNELGSRVYSGNVLNKAGLYTIDVSALPAGIYYVKVATTVNFVFKKLIVS